VLKDVFLHGDYFVRRWMTEGREKVAGIANIYSGKTHKHSYNILLDESSNPDHHTNDTPV
jgi:hypothetical protein